MPEALLGVFEVAELAGVKASAVANWRKRSSDFPAPLAELKAGPVFSESAVRAWLSQRSATEADAPETFYEQLSAKRGDSVELRQKVEEVVESLTRETTSTRRPGILLGGVQSGKTRAFLGVIARAFDRGFDVAIVLTKGTKSLAEQTLSRIKSDFREFIAADQIDVFDILSVPDLTPYELSRKLVFVVKKEDDNMRRLLELFQNTYPSLLSKQVLIIDDEADLASVSYRRAQGISTAGVISQQIDRLRDAVAKGAFLQVTATPYALYLQPNEDIPPAGRSPFLPKRPAFTTLLPVHSSYVGGIDYFEKSSDVESPAAFFYREVPLSERDALKKEDRRRLQIDRVLVEKNAAVLRDAVATFLVGGVIRRLQQKGSRKTLQKYSFLFHTEQSRGSHEWQLRVTSAIRDLLIDQAEQDSPLFNGLIHAAYSDLRRSVELEAAVPEFSDVKQGVVDALRTGQLMITKVNSDQEIRQLLDDEGQLRLRTPFNIFIGGQILDRGITINNLIAFYYGRNPQRFQQDTVLQHSRMYGARSAPDLAVTRFYAPLGVYQTMRRIHEFDSALRDAFESGNHERGVYFIQKDASQRLIPCSPNKLLFSDVVSVRPGRRLVLSGFQTVAKSVGAKNLTELDSLVDQISGGSDAPVRIPVVDAVRLLELAHANLEFDDTSDDDREAHVAALEHMSKASANTADRGNVWLMVAANRNVNRYRDEGRFSNAPDTKQQKEAAVQLATDIPVLMMLRQNGEEIRGWRNLPFWWPVIMNPANGVTVIFATEGAISSTSGSLSGNTRQLSTENDGEQVGD